MDTKQEDTTRTPKKPRIESEGQLIQTTEEEKGKKNMKVTGPTFKVRVYTFANTPTDSTSQIKDKT